MTNNSDLIAKLHTSQILVGLDLGEKTIGIAVSDQSLIIAGDEGHGAQNFFAAGAGGTIAIAKRCAFIPLG